MSGAWVRCAGATALATGALGVGAGSAPVAYAAVAVFGAAYTALSGVLVVWAVRSWPQRGADATVVLFVTLAVGQAAGALLLGLLVSAAPAGTVFSAAAVVGLAAAAAGGVPTRLRGGSSTPRRAPRRAGPR